MIKRLKLKFILTNMLLISIVMMAAFAIIYFSAEVNLENSSSNTMHALAQTEHKKPALPHRPDFEPREEFMTFSECYIIHIDEFAGRWHIEGADGPDALTEDDIDYVNELIAEIDLKNSDEGILEEYNMRYYYQKAPDGKTIVLMDKSFEDDNLNKLLLSFLLIGSIAFAAFLLISILVAGIAVKPVAKSIDQQKQLISDMSHELKTPITVISTNTDIVLSHNESTVNDEQKWLYYIKDETKRMSELVNMMLFLAKNDEATAQPLLTDLDLSTIAYEIALPFETVCFENKKKLAIDIEPGIFIKGDEPSVKQLMVILLDNALKYSNENGDIAIKVGRFGDKYGFSVQNSGEPIPKDSIPYIFDRFYRVDKARSRDKGGSGLGLSIAKKIIDNNNAAITVTSNAEAGTTFCCYFEPSKHKKR